MQALLDFHNELMNLYAFEIETSASLHQWTQFLQEAVAKSQHTTLDSSIIFGRDNPNSPDAKYQYAATYKDVIHASMEDGRNIRLHRNGVVALAYALWEDEYRNQIAKECGLADKNDVESDVFQDLNKYRQAILHVSGRLDRYPKVIRLFTKGQVVSFTKDNVHVLFSHLIGELNRIGEVYYGKTPNFSLDKSLNEA